MTSAQPTTTVLDTVPLKRALISVYDKTGLEELATGLHAAGVQIVSTGSTAQRIAAAGNHRPGACLHHGGFTERTLEPGLHGWQKGIERHTGFSKTALLAAIWTIAVSAYILHRT